uniref:RNA helicase n=1 Tax=Cyanistes caeruleus TaxID=156563 RepID=A0A8C0U2X1_CYACU
MVIPGTIPGFPGTGISIPGTIPGFPGTGITIPGTIPGFPGTGMVIPGTIPGFPGTGITIPGTIPGFPGTGITIPAAIPGFPADMVAQALELARKPHVVIATPGRLADHLRSSSTFSLRRIRFLVLDEADRLLEQGCADFSADLELILAAVPRRRQTLLFSATLTATLSELRGLAANSPFFWEAPSQVRTVEQLEQRYVLVPEAVKDAYLVQLVQSFQQQHEDWAIIIFTKTCKDCQVLNMMLRRFRFPSVALHSMMKQKQRFAALAKFKSSIFRILIATDVAARGLDIPAVQLVINHNTPGLPKIYIHRVGRTARAGRKGLAITLVTQYDIHLVHAIEEEIKLKLQEFPVEEQLVLDILTQVNVTRRECEIVSVPGNPWECLGQFLQEPLGRLSSTFPSAFPIFFPFFPIFFPFFSHFFPFFFPFFSLFFPFFS